MQDLMNKQENVDMAFKGLNIIKGFVSFLNVKLLARLSRICMFLFQCKPSWKKFFDIFNLLNSDTNSCFFDIYQVMVCSTIEELHTHIDVSQLTSDLGGTIAYDHSDWIQQRTVIYKTTNCYSNYN